MIPENTIASYLCNALAYLPSSFAKLVFLTSLRDPYTGRYVHEGWASCSSPDEVHEMLHEAHRIAFQAVLELPLLGMARELRKHFQSLEEAERRAAEVWLELEPYREMIPQGSPEICRRLFISQVRLALELLVHDPEWSCLKEPVSSPLQPPGQPHLPPLSS